MLKRRALSILLALAMLLSLFTAALAEDTGEDSSNVEPSSESVQEEIAEIEETSATEEAEAPEAETEAAPEEETSEETTVSEEETAEENTEVVEDEPAEEAAEEDELEAAEAEETAYSGYVLMNIPYTVFYRDIVGASNATSIDAITSATGKKAAYFWDSSYKGNTEVAFGEGVTIQGVRFPVQLSEEDLQKLPETSDSAAYGVRSYEGTPSLYASATVSDSGVISFSKAIGSATALSGAEVSISDESKHGDYMLTITNDGGVLSEANKTSFAVYGAVLKTADKEYPLYHLENLYYKDFNEIAFSTKSAANQKGQTAHTDYFADLEGATITGITYYTNVGIYTISTSVTVAPKTAAFSGYVLMNIPYKTFYSAIGAKLVDDVDAVTAATNKTGNYTKAGGAYHSSTTASVAEDGTVTAVGGANGSKLLGVIWPVQADSLDAVKALGGTEITDESSVVVATLGRGQTSSSTLVGYEALSEAPSYSYYVLPSAPASYLKLSGSSITAGSTSAVQQEKIDASVTYGTNYGDVQLSLAAAEAASGKTINGVVLTTDDGQTAALIHLANIWSSADMAWKADIIDNLDGKTITNVRYFLSVLDSDLTDTSAPDYVNYVYDYPVELKISQVYTGTTSAAFESAASIALTGLPEDIENPTARVYYTTGGRNATYDYLTPMAVDPADDDIDPVSVQVVDGKIAISAGSVTNAAGTTVAYGTPVDGTTYTIELASDNYIFRKISVTYEDLSAYSIDLSNAAISSTGTGYGVVTAPASNEKQLYARITWGYTLTDDCTLAFCAVRPVEEDMTFSVRGPLASFRLTMTDIQVALVTDKDADIKPEYTALATAKIEAEE